MGLVLVFVVLVMAGNPLVVSALLAAWVGAMVETFFFIDWRGRGGEYGGGPGVEDS